MPSSRILGYLQEHEELRAEGINLVVSENRPSPIVRRALASDLAGRYQAAGYGGSGRARDIVEAVEDLARKLFRVEQALAGSISGNLCVLAALEAFTSPGEAVAMLPFAAGGYPLGLEKFHRRRISLPADAGEMRIDVGGAVRVLVEEDVSLVFLGASFMPFPHPVREMREGLEQAGSGCLIAYDGSHVLGLIACGEFQDPLREGADILLGSTHKTFYGPQGGLVLTDSSETAASLRRMLELDLEGGIGLVDNPHLNRIAALGLALEEMLEDRGYGGRVVENARALGRAMHERGVPVRFADRGYTASHQILLALDQESGEKLCRDLETAGIFADAWARMGTAEVTHRGMCPADMERVAGWIAEIYHGRPPAELREQVRSLAASFML